MEKDSSKPRLSGVELAEEGAGGGDAIVNTESEGVEGVEVRQFGPRTDVVLVIFMEVLSSAFSTKKCVFICNCIKKGEDRGYKNITLKTIMNTTADKTVNKITHHVPPTQMIYTKKQIG
jgi:hypothetical protein